MLRSERSRDGTDRGRGSQRGARPGWGARQGRGAQEGGGQESGTAEAPLGLRPLMWLGLAPRSRVVRVTGRHQCR